MYAFMFDGLKRAGTKFDSIGQLNLTCYLGHSRGSARYSIFYSKPSNSFFSTHIYVYIYILYNRVYIQKFFKRIPELFHDFSAGPAEIVTTCPRIFLWGGVLSQNISKLKHLRLAQNELTIPLPDLRNLKKLFPDFSVISTFLDFP